MVLHIVGAGLVAQASVLALLNLTGVVITMAPFHDKVVRHPEAEHYRHAWSYQA